MYCIYCGSQNPDDANFCSNCGKEATASPSEETVESSESQSEAQVHHPWMPAQHLREQVQAHHPWMSAQEQAQERTQEESQEQVQEETKKPQEVSHQAQDRGEVPNALKSIWSRIRGWSKTKKILAGIAVFFLFSVCVGVIFGEPVEEDLVEVSTVKQSESDDGQPDCHSGELGKYVTSILTSTGPAATAADNIGSLFAQSGRSPALFLNQDWQDKMEENHKAMEDSISDIRDVSPPESVEDIHEILLEAVDDLDEGISLSSKGVREVDADSLSSGLPLIMSYNEKFNEYSSELIDYCGFEKLN